MTQKDVLCAVAKISTQRITDAACRFTQNQMLDWIQEAAGLKFRFTVSQLHEILKNRLPLEPYFQAQVLNALKETYPDSFSYKNSAGPYARGGIPDVTCILDGHYFGFEVKRPLIGRLSKLQEVTIRDINAAGGTACVVSTGEQAKEVIEKWRMNTSTFC